MNWLLENWIWIALGYAVFIGVIIAMFAVGGKADD